MIYTNKKFAVTTHEMPFGPLDGICLGKDRRGRDIILPTPRGVRNIARFCGHLSIGRSSSDRPRIDRRSDGELFMILCSEYGSKRPLEPKHVMVPQGQECEIIWSRQHLTDDDVAYDVVILKAHPGDIYRVSTRDPIGGYVYISYGVDEDLVVEPTSGEIEPIELRNWRTI